jgi:hypothetical protein
VASQLQDAETTLQTGETRLENARFGPVFVDNVFRGRSAPQPTHQINKKNRFIHEAVHNTETVPITRPVTPNLDAIVG